MVYFGPSLMSSTHTQKMKGSNGIESEMSVINGRVFFAKDPIGLATREGLLCLSSRHMIYVIRGGERGRKEALTGR